MVFLSALKPACRGAGPFKNRVFSANIVAQHLILRHLSQRSMPQTTERKCANRRRIWRCVANRSEVQPPFADHCMFTMQHSSRIATPKNASEQTSEKERKGTPLACLRLHSGPHVGIGGDHPHRFCFLRFILFPRKRYRRWFSPNQDHPRVFALL